MSKQTKFEIIKALAYGEEPQQIADAEGVDVSEVEKIQQTCADEITEEKDDLRKAGYLE